MSLIEEIALEIGQYVDRAEEERGRPFKETFRHPANGELVENGATIPVELLNRLRRALSGETK